MILASMMQRRTSTTRIMRTPIDAGAGPGALWGKGSSVIGAAGNLALALWRPAA
jgi:hypothetical protein